MSNINENQEVEKVAGTLNGKPIRIKKIWSTHEFTADECAKLFNGEIIEFETTSKKTGKPYTCKGKLEEQEYEGNTFVGFKPIFEEKKDDPEKFTGIWQGKEVRIKKIWSGHEFTPAEQRKLLDGEIITFTAISQKAGGKEYTVKGKLAEQEYEGNTFVGFKPEFS